MGSGARTDGAREAFDVYDTEQMREFVATYCECCKNRARGACRDQKLLDPFWRPNGRVGCLTYKSALK